MEPTRPGKILESPHDAPENQHAGLPKHAGLSRNAGVPEQPGAPASRIRRMFNGIAPRYDLINSLFSLRRDAFWRRKAVELACVRADDEVLDVACGTGEFTRAFASAGATEIVGCDFALEMLKRASSSTRRESGAVADRKQPLKKLLWCEADALRLPFASASFSIAACAFGVRNFESLDTGLEEMLRVLRPGGRAVILEFTRPRNRVARSLYELYANRVMPVAATLISGDRSGAYRYLPRSVVSFPSAEQMCARLRRAGFARATSTPLTMGVVTVYLATRE